MISLLFEPLAIAIHSIVGLIFVGTVGPHLWHRRAWIRAAASRLRQRHGMPPKMRWGAAQAVLLFALVIIVTVSGLWTGSERRPRLAGTRCQASFLSCVSWHAWTRRRWLLHRRPPGDASGRPAAARRPAQPQPWRPGQ